MMLLTLAVICVMLMLACGLGAFWALAKHPPVIHVDLGYVRIDMVGTLDMTQAIPSPLIIRMQQLAPIDDSSSTFIPMSDAVLAYCDMESESHARTSRKNHARVLRDKLGDWNLVLSALKQEDGID